MTLDVVRGNLFDATETYLCHQCNCVTNRAAHLAKDVFKKFPYVDVYSARKDRDKLGTIAIRGDGVKSRFVVALFGQYYPGFSKYKNDTPELREKSFHLCLVKLAELNGSFAFPWGVGCGAAGGNWDRYLKIIEDFSKNVDGVKIYRLEGS